MPRLSSGGVRRRRVLGVVVATTAMLLAGFQFPALASQWNIVADESRIAFSGQHAGTPFDGVFKRWTAEITFDPENLKAAKATVRVDLTSAETGNAMYDKTLPTGDWLNTGEANTAVFETTDIRRGDGENSYVANGVLKLRGAEVPVQLNFDLVIAGDGNRAEMTGTSTVARMDFGIGKASDASGAWVSLQIPLTIKVVATKAG